MANNSIGMKLPSIDELFSTQEERDINGRTKGRIVAVPLGQIDPFPDHPFSVRMDEDMEQLVESIKERGQITPAMVRQKPNGRYEMICGHRRAKACELAGLPTLLAEVKEMDRDEAIVYMVDSNLQRTHILPSEKAKAYQMKLDAMKRKSGRPSQKNYSPVGNNFSEATSADEMAKEIGDSKTQIFRYVRLNNLAKPLLDMVDEGKIALRPAVELSYLPQEQQEQLCDAIDAQYCTPSLSQAQKLRRFSEGDKLDENVILSIMTEEKPNQREKFTIPAERLRGKIPEGLSERAAQDFIVKAVDHYNRFLERQKRSVER